MVYKVHHCQVCKVRRRFTYLNSVNVDNFHVTERWQCSKGHLENIYRVTSKWVNHALKAIYLPKLQEMFTHESPLLARLSKR